MEIRIMQVAKGNLESIFDYHVEYDRTFAVNFQLEITDYLVLILSEHPNIGAIHSSEKSIRRIIYKTYNIYYRVCDEWIEVLYILHSRLRLNEDIK